MKASQYNAKIFTRSCERETLSFIDVFHGWIQNKKLDELLIDVADYTHVSEGPGVIIVGHESYYGMDETDGRLGMLYRRRRGEAEEAAAGLRAAAHKVLSACKLIEDELADVRFDSSEIVFGFDDRLHAPNDAATFNALKPALETLGAALYGGEVAVTQLGETRDPFRASLKSAAETTIDKLLQAASP